MKIIELNIVEFGAFKDKKICFEDGVNIVRGDNEAGKSTIVLFIKFMLYGLGRKNAKGAERERALSLDGERAAGTMTLEKGGVKYFLERSAASGGRKGESVRLTDLSTGETFREEIAELLVGVPQEVFESSVLINQMKAAQIKGEQMGTAIDNMLSSADESVDVSTILKNIDEVRKEYKLNRGEGGRLYETEKKLSELLARRKELTEKYLEAQALSARLERTKKSIEITEEAYARSKQLLDDVQGAGVILRFEELAKKREELRELSYNLAQLEYRNSTQNFLPDREHTAALHTALKNFEYKAEQLEQRKREERELPTVSDEVHRLARLGKSIEGGLGEATVARVKAITEKKNSLLGGGIACVICAILSATVGAALLGAMSVYICATVFGVAGALAVAAICLLALSVKQKKKRDAECIPYGLPFDKLEVGFSECIAALEHCRQIEKQSEICRARLDSAIADKSAAENALCKLLKKTVVPSEETEANVALCRAELERLGRFCAEREKNQATLCALEAYIKRLADELSVYDEAELRRAVRTDPHTLTPKAIENARTHERYDRERLERLRIQKENQAITLAGMKIESETPATLADKIGLCEQRLRADREYFDALMLAKEHIERASIQISRSVTPEISKRAGELMAEVSGGAHEFLQTTKTFDVSVENKGFLISSELLSGGAKDAMYICLRIALAEKMFDGESVPLILDEALCQLDDTRAARLLSLLCGLSEHTQCIIFTCHTREAVLCERTDTPFKLHLL